MAGLFSKTISSEVERRGKVDEVNGFGLQVIAQDVEVVAEEKLIHPRFGLAVGAVDGKENGPPPKRKRPAWFTTKWHYCAAFLASCSFCLSIFSSSAVSFGEINLTVSMSIVPVNLNGT